MSVLKRIGRGRARFAVRAPGVEPFAVAGILLLAGTLRLGWAGVNSFAFDEAHLSLIALRMARAGDLARLGMPSSAGVPNLPAAAWIYALPFRISPDPLSATLFTGGVGLLALAAVWWLARRTWGAWAAFVAALFLAASPYGVLYARSIWAQNLLAPLAVLWAWAACEGARGAGRRRAFAIAFNVLLAGFAFQVHFAGAALVPGTLYFAARYRWWRTPRPFFVGGALAAALLVPFVVEVACCAPHIITEFRAVLGNPAQIDLIGFRETARLASGSGWSFLLTGDLDTVSDSPLPVVVVAVLLAAGVVVLARDIRRPNPAPESPPGRRTGDLEEEAPARSRPAPADERVLAELVMVWALMSSLFFVRHSTPVFIHYQLASLPALGLIAGASVRLSRRRAWRAGVALAVTGVAVFWSAAVGRGLSQAGAVVTPRGLGTPLQATRRAAYGLPDDAPVVFFTHGDDPAQSGETAVFEALWWGREHRIVDGRSVVILPAQPAYLMATLAPFQAWEELEASNLVTEALQFARRDGALPFVATRYDGVEVPAGFTMIEPVRFADGAQLEGWRARRVGPRLRFSTLWQVVEQPPSGVFQQFHHLRDSPSPGGEPLLISDVPLSNQAWRAGDRVIVMGDFFVEDGGTLWVDVGHYTLPDVARFPREDGEGDLVRLGPFSAP